MSKELFVVYSGQDTDFEPNTSESYEGCDPIAFLSEKDARETFKGDIDEHLVSKNRGHYLVKLSEVPEDKVDTLLDPDNLLEVFKNDFKGYKVEVLDSWAVELSNWLPEALGADDSDEKPEGAIDTENGWVYVESNDKPYED